VALTMRRFAEPPAHDERLTREVGTRYAGATHFTRVLKSLLGVLKYVRKGDVFTALLSFKYIVAYF